MLAPSSHDTMLSDNDTEIIFLKSVLGKYSLIGKLRPCFSAAASFGWGSSGCDFLLEKELFFLYIWSKRYYFSGRLVGQVGGWKNLKSTVTTEFECYYFDQPNHNDILFEVSIQVVYKLQVTEITSNFKIRCNSRVYTIGMDFTCAYSTTPSNTHTQTRCGGFRHRLIPSRLN